jgi:hypothetical protein
MFKSIFTILPLLSALSTLVSADVTPTSPDGNTVVKVGQTAEAMWSKDTQGNWTDVTIKLMTGDNFNMVEVTSKPQCCFSVKRSLYLGPQLSPRTLTAPPQPRSTGQVGDSTYIFSLVLTS